MNLLRQNCNPITTRLRHVIHYHGDSRCSYVNSGNNNVLPFVLGAVRKLRKHIGVFSWSVIYKRPLVMFSYWQYTEFLKYLRPRKLCMYSNLPNNRVGPNNCVGRGFLRN